jgi:hypothetical protein
LRAPEISPTVNLVGVGVDIAIIISPISPDGHILNRGLQQALARVSIKHSKFGAIFGQHFPLSNGIARRLIGFLSRTPRLVTRLSVLHPIVEAVEKIGLLRLGDARKS